jgi:hypothetical protein
MKVNSIGRDVGVEEHETLQRLIGQEVSVHESVQSFRLRIASHRVG